MSKSVFVSLSIVALSCGAQAVPLQYDVTELPAQPVSADEPNYVSGYAIDEKGRVLISVGINSVPFSSGELCHKGKCQRVKPKGQSATWYDFNGFGVLVGAVNDGFDRSPARRRSDGTIEVLGDSGFAWGVNSAGVAVGSYHANAFYYDTEMHLLPTLGGSGGNAFAITDDGLIVGDSRLEDEQTRAVIFEQGGAVTNLGVLDGGTRSSASAINPSGVAVGCSNKANHPDIVPVKFEAGTVKSLGTLGGSWGCAQGINKAGVVVGLTTIKGGAETHAFVYQGKTMVDLNSAISVDAQGQWLLYSAVAINNAGQIVANARRRSDSASVALLLTPKP